MAETILGNVLELFHNLGIYDIILPFLLTFTIIFAILERTKVLGVEEGKTKKNLNAMVAFVMGFLVVASSQLVQAITTISSQIVVLLMLGVFFLLLIGTFNTDEENKEGVKLHTAWKVIFGVIMFIGIVFIFLDAIKTDNKSWLDVFIDWISQFSTNTAVASIILLIVIIGAVVFITWKKD